jgi:CheY-like chemotaxis protein
MTEGQTQSESSATILVAEDEELIRFMLVELLQDEKFNVLEAADGAAALRQLQSHTGISLLITDISLPGLNGRQLALQGRRLHPTLKAIFVTGYSPDSLKEQKADEGGDDLPGWLDTVPVIRKPFDLAELVAMVRSSLAAK